MNSLTENSQNQADSEATAETPRKVSNSNKIQFRWKGKIVKESIYKQRLALIEAAKKRRLSNLAQVEADPKIPVEGRRIVDLELLAKHLKCNSCKEILSLADTRSETRRGLASILHVRCRKCSQVNCVPTSKNVPDNNSRSKLYTVNCDVVNGTLQAGMTCNRLNKLLASLNIPQLQWKLFQRYKHETTAAASETEKDEKNNFSADPETVRNTDDIRKILTDFI